ncbi:hypothetical protein FV227_16825 [Methylobacterium sp. WL119]|nr:hypothetical protein FV225_07365 [Methylobacterium sp. WL93]TXN49364.1 hypothetical protein FV227_16825 [Methylobacterium sp. WL119]
MRRPAVGDDLGRHASVATTGRYLHARPSESSARFLGVGGGRRLQRALGQRVSVSRLSEKRLGQHRPRQLTTQ